MSEVCRAGGCLNRPSAKAKLKSWTRWSKTSYVSVATFAAAGGKTVETVWLCKICGEEREMWRKSGAWFFKVGQGQSENVFVTEILSHLGAKLRNLADRQAGAGCYSLATLSSNDSKNEDPVWCLT